MSGDSCAWCSGPVGSAACAACGRAAVDGLRPGVWVLDRYRLTLSMGADGLGGRWFGVDEAGTTVAVHALDRALLDPHRRRERFVQAQQRLRAHSHPHAQPLLDVGALADGTLALVRAWRTGRTLAAAMLAGRLHPSDASRVVEQLALALGALHRRGLAHGDVKPETVLCTGEGSLPGDAWLLDVGLLHALVAAREGEAPDTVLGTPAFMAPERFTGSPPDARSDLYGLALVAYEMFEGQPPFHATTAWDWAACHLTREPRPWSAPADRPAAPARMRAAISRCLARRPEARFATAEEFLSAACEPADDLFGPIPPWATGPGPYRGSR